VTDRQVEMLRQGTALSFNKPIMHRKCIQCRDAQPGPCEIDFSV